MKTKKPYTKRIISFLILAFVFINITDAQIRVTEVKNGQANANVQGVFYCLPQTYLTFDIYFDVTIEKRGPYYQFANKYLGLNDVISSDAEHYEIGEVFISTFNRPDPEQFYFVEYGERAKKDELSVLLTLSESGFIIGMNELTEIEKIETQILEQTNNKEFSKQLFKYFAEDNFYKKIDTIIRKINIDTITIEKEIYKYSMAKKSLEQKAKEAANFISRIRENRFLLISGYQEVNYGVSIEYMDKQLQKLENEYLKLFTGVTMYKSFSKSFEFLPQKEKIEEAIPLFKFSGQNGVAEENDRSAQNVNVFIESNGVTEGISKFAEANKNDVNNLSGYYYRIPEYANIQLIFNNKVFFKTNKRINQFGVISRTPSFNSKIEFYQNTGNIKKILVH